MTVRFEEHLSIAQLDVRLKELVKDLCDKPRAQQRVLMTGDGEIKYYILGYLPVEVLDDTQELATYAFTEAGI